MFREQYRLLSNSTFRRFTLSCALAMFGNGLTYVIMIWALMQFHASIVSTASLMTCFWLPNVIFGPFFGVLTDSWNRRRILLFTNGMRALCLFVFALLINSHMNPTSIYILASILGTLLASYIPAAMTFVRELVSPDDLMYGNATVDIAYELGAVMGMGGAGLILAVTSFATCFIINACCYLLAMLMLYRIPHVPNASIEKQKRESMWKKFVMGARYISKRKPLFWIYVTQGLFFVCYMTAPVLLAPYAKTVLHSNVGQFGFLEAMLSFGIILGGFISPWLATWFSLFRVVLAQVLLGIFGFYLFSHTSMPALAIFYHFLIGLSFSSWALLTTLAQEMTALNYQGRVQSLFNSLSGAIIIVFYYALAAWQNVALTKLYYGEISLLVLAIICLLLMALSQRRLKIAE